MKSLACLKAFVACALLSVLTATNAIAAPNHSSGPYGYYVSEATKIHWIDQTKSVRFAIKIQKNWSEVLGTNEYFKYFQLCNDSELPDLITVEILDAETNQVLLAIDRTAAHLKDSSDLYQTALGYEMSCSVVSSLDFSPDYSEVTMSHLMIEKIQQGTLEKPVTSHTIFKRENL